MAAKQFSLIKSFGGLLVAFLFLISLVSAADDTEKEFNSILYGDKKDKFGVDYYHHDHISLINDDSDV